jgi:hypothetical protein
MKEFYAKQVRKHIVGYEGRINILVLREWQNRHVWQKEELEGFDSWSGSEKLETGRRDGVFYLNERYLEFFQKLSYRIGVENPIETLEDTLMDDPNILASSHPEVSDDYDILLINSKGWSKQYTQPQENFDDFISELRGEYKIITTKEVKDKSIPCTLDYGLNLLEIGNISTKVKYVVAVATAPIVPCMNVWSMNTVKKWAILSNRSSYSYRDNIFRYSDVSNVIKTGFFEN